MNEEHSEEVGWKDSLLFKVNGIIMLVLLISLVGLGLIINNFVAEELTTGAQEKNLEIVESLQVQAQEFLNNSERAIKVLAEFESTENLERSVILDRFQKFKEEYSHFLHLYVGTAKGQMIIGDNANLPEDFDPRTRPWYKKAKEEQKIVWTDVFTDAGTGKQIITVAMPIMSNGEFKGVIAGDINLTSLNQEITSKNIGDHGYAYMINSEGQFIAHPDQQLVNEKFNANQIFDVSKVYATDQGSMDYDFEGEHKVASYIKIDRIDSMIFTQIPAREFHAAKERLQLIILGISLGILFLLGGLIYWINQKYLLKPISELITDISQVAQGDLTVEIDDSSTDELGQVRSALDEMVNNLEGMMVNILEVTENLSAYSEELSASAQEGNATIEETNNLIEDITSNIQQISATTAEIRSFAQESTGKTEVGEENMTETINSMQKINSTVQSAVKVIDDLDDTSQEIGQVVELINNIAEQTNMLALNASIEAARAGEHGEGFAVVAEEIRELAEQTAEATGDITDLVNTIQQKSNTGLEAIKGVEAKVKSGQEIAEETGEIFTEINQATEQTSEQIEETASATDNLVDDSEQIKSSGDNIANMSEEVANSSQELASMAQKLQQLISDFKV
ncbi:MAG: methyl-accepting chemotaxis protein [Bacillota bacterium]